ncbi:hypothetical protein M0R45_033413 [Rubus argutus]|uniref:Uncharacterized protein n=1 Tax=Rubus argutus TaxID=59490 RepID=A0AAW1WK67_RUBAR
MQLRTQKEEKEGYDLSLTLWNSVELVYYMITAGFEKLLTFIICASGGLRLGGPGAESEARSLIQLRELRKFKDLESIWLRAGWDTDA